MKTKYIVSLFVLLILVSGCVQERTAEQELVIVSGQSIIEEEKIYTVAEVSKIENDLVVGEVIKVKGVIVSGQRRVCTEGMCTSTDRCCNSCSYTMGLKDGNKGVMIDLFGGECRGTNCRATSCDPLMIRGEYIVEGIWKKYGLVIEKWESILLP